MFAKVSYGVTYSLDGEFRTNVEMSGTVTMCGNPISGYDVKTALISLIPDSPSGYSRISKIYGLDQYNDKILNWCTLDLEDTIHMGKGVIDG
jgi:hypothetical protein